jgi:hypothetical protein
MAFGGAALKLFQTFLYVLCFCCAAIILGIYSYFLSVQADRNVSIPQWQKAVEGMSGIGVVYTIFAIILTCCLGGKTFFAFLAVLFDVLLCAAFVAIAVMTRDGAQKCTGNSVDSPLGSGPANSHGSFGVNGFGTGKGENVSMTVHLPRFQRLTVYTGHIRRKHWLRLPPQQSLLRCRYHWRIPLPLQRSDPSLPWSPPSKREAVWPIAKEQLYRRLRKPLVQAQESWSKDYT